MTISLTAAVLLTLMQAVAQPPAPPTAAEPPNEVEGVVVTGRRDGEAAQRKAESEFVRELGATTPRDRLARWNGSLCVGVVGLPQKHAAYIADRIAQETLAAGLDVGPPGCTPNSLILFTSEADKTAADFRKQRRAFFTGGAASSGLLEAGGGGQRIKDFLTSSRPVRWWHIALKTGSDGRPITGGTLQTTTSSRLASNYREDLSRAVIIVDATRVRGATYEALASYLAMVALAQLDPEAQPKGLETIMTLFADRDAGRPPAETLTDWDRAYLKGLYAAPDDARNLNAQRGAIRRSLKQTREGGD